MVEKSLRAYQEGMDAVDRGDQYREMGAGFASKSHYKKWYKKAVFAVYDFMLLNSFFAWNMAAEDPSLKRFKIKKHLFCAALLKEMLAFSEDDDFCDEDFNDPDVGSFVRIDPTVDHYPNKCTVRTYCVVCKLEEKWRSEAMPPLKDVYGHTSRISTNMACCGIH